METKAKIQILSFTAFTVATFLLTAALYSNAVEKATYGQTRAEYISYLSQSYYYCPKLPAARRAEIMRDYHITEDDLKLNPLESVINK
jgi:hypothetical protein